MKYVTDISDYERLYVFMGDERASAHLWYEDKQAWLARFDDALHWINKCQHR